MFLSLKNSENGAFLKTPFYPYLRAAENQQFHVTALVKYNGGARDRVTNIREIRRSLTNLRFLVPELEDIFQQSISMLPEHKATLEKWIQTGTELSGKVREFRRVLFFNRAIDIKKVRNLMADINAKIYFVRTNVEILKHRLLLKKATSPLLTMIEDFQLDFPDSLHLKFGGESTQQTLLGVKIYLRCDLCMKKLCLENITAVVTFLDSNGCGSHLFPGTKFYVSGKAPKMLSLSPGKILILPEGQPINIVFERDSEHLSIEFGVWIRILGLSKLANATLDKTQLSVKVKGEIFEKFSTKMNVSATIEEKQDWNSLLFLVEGKMLKSSLLPNMLQGAVNKYLHVLAENAQTRIQKAENASMNAKRKIKDAETILETKEITLANVSRILEDKTNNLVKKRIAYARRKIQFNSTLLRYLHFKDQTLCEMRNCENVDLNTCIPDVCRKEIKTTYTVPDCKEVNKKINVVRLEEVSERACYKYQTPKEYSVHGGGWWNSQKLTVSGGETKKECYNKIRHERKTKEVNVKKFECAGNPKVLDSISGYTQPYECCNKAITEKVQILNPQCVRYNSDCWENMTEFSQQLTRQHDNRSALFADFQYLSEMGQQVDFAQMEVNTARTRVRLASNQVKLARALLQQQQYAEKSISISKIKDQEQLGIGLAHKMKALGGKELISVESLLFSTWMTSATKSLLPFLASVKDVDGRNKFIEFPMEFKRLEYSINSASKLIIQTIFGKANTRKRRSTHEDFVEDELGMDIGQRMCFFSHKANAFFKDVIDSLEFLIESANVYFKDLSSGINEVDSHFKDSVDKSSSPGRKIQTSFREMMESLKDNYMSIRSETTWENMLEKWRDHLNVLTSNNNFTKCSGIQDCLDYYFRNLEEFYLFLDSQRALEIKQKLQEMKTLFNSLLQRNYSLVEVQEIVFKATALLNNTNDDSVLCGTSPVIVKSSPAEVVVLTGDTVNLTCLVSNSNEVEIVWIKNERVIEDMNDEVLVLKNANTETEGVYHCEVSNNRGSTVSNVTIVVVQEAPRITEHPRDVRVLVGTETLSMICNSDGVPKPTTEWFFKSRMDKVIRMNSLGRILTKKNLSSQDSGFYYCNVSNIHGTTTSRMARLNVLRFTPGKPRIAVSLKFARCAFDSFPYNASNCTTHHYTPPLQLNYTGFQTFFREITGKMRWAWKQIERRDSSPYSDVSLSFVITANGSNMSSNVSSDIIAALNSFSLSRSKLARDLWSFRAALEERKFHFIRKNELIVLKNGGFAAELVTQKCLEGKEADENGFLCGGYYFIL